MMGPTTTREPDMKHRWITVLVALACVAALATGCKQGVRAGTRCRTTDWGDDGTYVLKCQGGRWVRSLTKAQAATFIIALLKAKQTITTTTTPTPNPVVPTAVTAGSGFTCALLSDTTVKCWGENTHGQLGNGTFQPSAFPVTVTGLTGATAIAAGSDHACALLSSGSIRCWGENTSGQLGDGSSGTTRTTPVTTIGVSDARSITASTGGTCALLASGVVKCWGDNTFGEIGNGTTGGVVSAPTAVSGLANVAAVIGGSYHNCVLLTDHSAKCWGANINGEVGDGTNTSPRSTPVAVTGLTTATDLGAGGDTTCAVLSGGTAKCWGYNNFGNVGDGTSGTARLVPTSVSGLTTAVAITGGNQNTCALLSDGTAKCWGENDLGQIGDGFTAPTRLTPTAVSALTGATAITTGGAHSCAIVTDHSVRCWGANTAGQVGDGTSSNIRTTPTKVAGLG